MGVMKPDKVLVVEYDNAIRKELVAVLSDAGYVVSAVPLFAAAAGM